MPLFYVYLNWYRANHKDTAGKGRNLLTCESRYTADEFFRTLKTLRHPNGNLWYRLLERTTPQLWYYDTINDDPWHSVRYVLQSGLVNQFRPKIMSQLLEDAEGRAWPTIPLVDELEWVHNGLYYIRNKREPNKYWYHCDGYIRLSTTAKTRFRFEGADFGSNDKTIFIPSDRVIVSLATTASTEKFVSKGIDTRLNMSWDKREWKFGEFINGFGVHPSVEGMTDREFIISAKNGEGDKWELC